MTLMRHSDFRRNRSFFCNPASEVRAILFIPVIWGNICGGVFIVSPLNHGQVKEL
jgi:formate/nitrite transporter FocA (FNT family)